MRLFAGLMLIAVTLTGAQAASPRLTPLAAYTIVYDVRGHENGTITQYSRNFGAEQAQVNDFTGPTGKPNRARLITRGDTIVGYDPQTRRAAQIVNPSYQTLVQVAAGKSDGNLAKAMLQALAFVPTGTQHTYAGEMCRVWENTALHQTRCVTVDGLALHIHIAAGGAPLDQTARRVRRGAGGPADIYGVPAGVTVARVRTLRALPGIAP